MTKTQTNSACLHAFHKRTLLIAALLSSFVIRHSSFASPLTIQLVSEVTSIQPGTPFHAGLHLVHKEHYHTYWKFPGIVGVPTEMKWDLPPGWKAGDIEWPAPERVMMFQIKAQGFHGEVLLPIKLTPPKDLEPGAKVTLKGKATWMCCGRECNPDFADLSVTLPVDKLPAPLDMRTQKLFATARANMPRSLLRFVATATREGDRVVLRLTPNADASAKTAPPWKEPRPAGSAPSTPRRKNFFQRIFVQPKPEAPKATETVSAAQTETAGIFFTEDGYINADKDQIFRKDGDALVVELIVSTYFTEKQPPAELRGILWLKDGSLGKGAIIRAPFAK